MGVSGKLRVTLGSIYLTYPPLILPHFECLCASEFQSHPNLYFGNNLKEPDRYPLPYLFLFLILNLK